jgi:hypothetical protein
MMLHTLDPLTLPLSGLQLIEASAGTGKTWTLAALYVRLVLGHSGPAAGPLGAGLFPPQILVMTFTEAATAELRERIRERLAQAAHFLRLVTRHGCRRLFAGAACADRCPSSGRCAPGGWTWRRSGWMRQRSSPSMAGAAACSKPMPLTVPACSRRPGSRTPSACNCAPRKTIGVNGFMPWTPRRWAR